MSARILVVDDVPANVKLLEARLSAEYFDVLTASNGAEALSICTRAECDNSARRDDAGHGWL
jgi:two-component system, cell cycle response regulator